MLQSFRFSTYQGAPWWVWCYASTIPKVAEWCWISDPWRSTIYASFGRCLEKQTFVDGISVGPMIWEFLEAVWDVCCLDKRFSSKSVCRFNAERWLLWVLVANACQGNLKFEVGVIAVMTIISRCVMLPRLRNVGVVSQDTQAPERETLLCEVWHSMMLHLVVAVSLLVWFQFLFFVFLFFSILFSVFLFFVLVLVVVVAVVGVVAAAGRGGGGGGSVGAVCALALALGVGGVGAAAAVVIVVLSMLY